MHPLLLQLSGSISQRTTTSNDVIHSDNLSLNMMYFKRGHPAFGLRYFLESRNENSQSLSGEAYGPALGYFDESGAFALINYDLKAKLGTWTDGDGLQFDLGYMENIGSQLHLGGKVSLKNTRYRADASNSSVTEKRIQDTFISAVLTYLF